MPKDKFKQMQQNANTLGDSFMEIASTVAAIENAAPQSASKNEKGRVEVPTTKQDATETSFIRLPSPPVTTEIYDLVYRSMSVTRNITRQDWVELAIIEKLHNEGILDDDRFQSYQQAVISRPPRGMRKGTKTNK